MADRFNFEQVKRNIEAMKTALPIVLANQAQNFFVSSWDKQGWDGKKWKEVGRRVPGTAAYKYPKNKDLGRRTKAILVQSGALRRAVATSVRTQTFNKIRLVVDLDYAAYHNDGTDNLPERAFMKDSPILREMQQKKIKQFIDRIWQK